MDEIKKMDKFELDNLLFDYYSKTINLKGYQIKQIEIENNFIDAIVMFEKKDAIGEHTVIVWLNDMIRILENTLDHEYYDLKVLIEEKKITGIEYKVRTKSKQR